MEEPSLSWVGAEALLTFTVYQVAGAQKALRSVARLPEERFPIQVFIGMLGDEIQALRESGKTDREIASLINWAAGVNITASDVTEYYAPSRTSQLGALVVEWNDQPWISGCGSVRKSGSGLL